MNKQENKKKKQLGMNHGKARNKLVKTLLFTMATRLNENICFQCSLPITKEEDFSIEHKIPWLDSEKPVKLFFDLDNISFSHKKCNYGAARRYNQKYFTIEDRHEANKLLWKERQKRYYTTEKRRVKYIKHGY